MSDVKIKELAINYTARNFSSIKDELVSYTKRYYPETFKDFSEASFGALMLDMVSYVGDILSFYVDYQANESFLQTAIEYGNIINLSRQLGYKFDASATSYGELDLYILVPAMTAGGGPDRSYMPVLTRGSSFSSTGGSNYILMQDVDFKNSNNDVLVGTVNEETGAPLQYAIRARGQVMSGQIHTSQFEIDDFKKFRKLEIPGGPNVAEIISVFDLLGNTYHEVDYLTQDIVYKNIINPSPSERTLAPNILKPVPVPRRFVVEKNVSQTMIIFGHGSESDLASNTISEPNKVILDMHGRDYVTDRSFDPNNLISSDKLGVGPSNTALTVVYRITNASTSNAPTATVTTVNRANFIFDNSSDLLVSRKSAVKRSLEITNPNPILGDQVNLSVDDLRMQAQGMFYSQNRAVTAQDYKTLAYSMPKSFGAISRCRIMKDQDSFKRNLNLYILCQGSDQKFSHANVSIKKNLKAWLNKYRMINDSIDILDAQFVNLGVKFEILSEADSNKAVILNDCLQALADKLTTKPDIGESLNISQIYKLLNGVNGVADTTKVEIVHKAGTLYSDVFFDVTSALAIDGRTLRIPSTVAYEFKYTDDFEGVVR